MQVSNESELSQAIEHGADNLVFDDLTVEISKPLIARARELSERVSIECCGSHVTLETARELAEAGADRLSISTLSRPVPRITFRLAVF